MTKIIKDAFIIVRIESEKKAKLLKKAQKRGITLSRLVTEKLDA